MTRLIDADALKEVISGNSYILSDSINSKNFGMFLDGIEQAIDEAPTIDAVPVIRCRDCKHWLKGDGSCFPHADYNDFCSNGERRDDETD